MTEFVFTLSEREEERRKKRKVKRKIGNEQIDAYVWRRICGPYVYIFTFYLCMYVHIIVKLYTGRYSIPFFIFLPHPPSSSSL